MKVFISWSGETSKQVAVTLRDWLPSVVQSIIPYVSSEDINKGVRWSGDISSQLDSTSFGVICLTPDNLEAPWIHFEAGALSKSVDKSRVAPFLLGIRTSDVRGPLVQFQSTLFSKEDVKKLLLSINDAEDEGGRLDETRLAVSFDVWWPRLESNLKEIEASIPKKEEKAPRQNAEQRAEIIEEMLVLLRAQQKQLSDPESLLPPEYLRQVMRRVSAPPYHPVYRDLYEGWSSLNRVLDELGPSDSITKDDLKTLLSELGGPIRYIVRNNVEQRGGRVGRHVLAKDAADGS